LTDCAKSFKRGPPHLSLFLFASRTVDRVGVWPVWRPVSASAPPVKGLLRRAVGGRKSFF